MNISRLSFSSYSFKRFMYLLFLVSWKRIFSLSLPLPLNCCSWLSKTSECCFRPDRYVPLFGEFFYDSAKWRESEPFAEQLKAFQELIEEGKVLYYCTLLLTAQFLAVHFAWLALAVNAMNFFFIWGGEQNVVTLISQKNSFMFKIW